MNPRKQSNSKNFENQHDSNTIGFKKSKMGQEETLKLNLLIDEVFSKIKFTIINKG